MEYAEVEADVRKLAREWHDQCEVAAAASHDAAVLSKILAAYIELFPQLEKVVRDVGGRVPEDSGEDGDAPKGAEAVRIILQGSTKEPILVSEMVDVLRSRGWLPDSDNPANAVRAALERLAGDEDSDVFKIRYGDRTVRYVYDPDYDRNDLPTVPQRALSYDDEEPF